MGPIWELFKAALGFTVDVTGHMVSSYWKFLKKLAKWCLAIVLISLPLLIIGSLLHMAWMNAIYLFIVGVVITIWLLAAFPVVMLLQYAFEEIKLIKRTTQLIGGILFWILLLAIYFWLVPVWNYPAAIPLVFIICAVLALGFMVFGIGINPKLAIGVVLIIFFLITVSFFMPTTRSSASTLAGWLDRKVAGFIAKPQLPKGIDYDLVSIERITFFDSVTGKPTVWCYKGKDGRFELFDSPGYHPQYKVPLEPISPDIVAQIKSQLKADAERVALEEQKKKEEAEKIAKLNQPPKVPKHLDYNLTSIEKMTFFDQVTSEPRIWCYKGEDGKYELFDSPGYHPQYKAILEPISPDIVAQIKSQLKADAERITLEEQKKKEEAEKIAKLNQPPKVPKHLDYKSHFDRENDIF